MTGMEFAPVRHALTITLVQQLSAHSNNFDGLLINRFPMFSFSNNGDDTLPGVQTAFEMVPREISAGQGSFQGGLTGPVSLSRLICPKDNSRSA